MNPEDITHIHISLQFGNEQKMEAAVHLRLLNFITMFNKQKEERNQETPRDTSPTEVVPPPNSELFLVPKKSLCLASFSMKLGFCISSPLCLFPSMYCWPTIHHCWPTIHPCWPKQRGLRVIRFPWAWKKQAAAGKPRSQLFTHSPTIVSKTVNNL